MNTKSAKNRGFTLIELIVVISIMVILTSSLILNFGTANKNRDIASARNFVVSDLRKAQSFSLSARDISSGVHSSAYGLRLDGTNPNSYSIVAWDNAPTPNQTVLTTVKLPTNIQILGMSVRRPDNTLNLVSDLTIIFKAPYARVAFTYLGSTEEYNDFATLVFGTPEGDRTFTVSVDGISGNFTVQ